MAIRGILRTSATHVLTRPPEWVRLKRTCAWLAGCESAEPNQPPRVAQSTPECQEICFFRVPCLGLETQNPVLCFFRVLATPDSLALVKGLSGVKTTWLSMANYFTTLPFGACHIKRMTNLGPKAFDGRLACATAHLEQVARENWDMGLRPSTLKSLAQSESTFRSFGFPVLVHVLSRCQKDLFRYRASGEPN